MINCLFKIGQLIGGGLIPPTMNMPMGNPMIDPNFMGNPMMDPNFMGQGGLPIQGPPMQPFGFNEGGMPPINFAEQLSTYLASQGGQPQAADMAQQYPVAISNTGMTTPTLWQPPGPVDYQNILLGLKDNPMQYLEFGTGQPAF